MNSFRELSGIGKLPLNWATIAVNSDVDYIWDASDSAHIGTVGGSLVDGAQVNAWQHNWGGTAGPGSYAGSFANGTPANCPLYRPNGVNGNAYIETNGINHQLTVTVNSAQYMLPRCQGNSYETFVVVKIPTVDWGAVFGTYRDINNASWQQLFFGKYLGLYGPVGVDQYFSYAQAVSRGFLGGTSANFVNNSNYNTVSLQSPVSNMYVVSYTNTSGSCVLRVNGDIVSVTHNQSYTGVSPTSTYSIGKTIDGVDAMPIACHYYYMMLTGALNDIQRMNITRHLGARFGANINGVL